MPCLKIIQNGKEKSLTFEGEVPLRDILTREGFLIPHPCGGKGTCGKCTVTVNGDEVLSCRHVLSGDTVVILPEPESLVGVTGTADTGKAEGEVCLCLDVGTTTLALALVSPKNGTVIRAVTAPNPQRTFGSDVISRIDRCMKNGPEELRGVLVSRVAEMARELLASADAEKVKKLYVSGNTTMLHLFCGEDCSSMGVSPYTPVFLDRRVLSGESVGLPVADSVILLPGIAAFVGADIVSGIGYVGMPRDGRWRILLDLGTNAEIALFSKERILCTAAAAGPCFEGANISCGMTADAGAVCACDGNGKCTVIGGCEPAGICATGLIDVIAEGVRSEYIDESGYLEDDPLPVSGKVTLSGRDVREFQLAKSAIRAGLECLMKRAGVTPSQIEGLYVAGGFSAGINVGNAAFLGLIPESLEAKFCGVNNSSLLGTVKYACTDEKCLPPLDGAEYVDLSADPHFSSLFMEYMTF